MSKPAFWANYDVGRIVSEAGMLDIRNLSIGAKERYELEGKKSVVTSCDASSTPTGTGGGSPNEDEPVRLLRPIDLSSGKAVIYIQDMVEASVALKSNIDLEILKPTSSVKSGFMTRAFASAGPSTPPNASSDGDSSTHVAQAISGLQREVLLLRNELNFELWHSRENSKHIGRLYKDRILMRTAESERQGLVRGCQLSLRVWALISLPVQQAATISGSGHRSGEGTTRSQGNGGKCEEWLRRLGERVAREAQGPERGEEENGS